MRILILLGLLLVLLYLVLSGGGVALFKVIGDPTMSIIMTLYVITWVAFLRLVIWAVRSLQMAGARDYQYGRSSTARN